MGRHNLISSRRVHQLDGLRGIAALGVVAFHFLYLLPSKFPEVGAALSPFILGRHGVQLFFVISGFVIMMSIQGATLRSFAASRVSRLYPTYWAALIVTFIIASLWLPGYDVTAPEAAINLTMFQKFFGVPDVDGTYWTLAVEVAFYVQCAVLSALGLFSPRRLPITLAVWLAASVLVVAVVNSSGLSDSAPVLANALDIAFDYIPFFVSGIAVLQVYRAENTRAMYGLLAAAAVAMLLIHQFADVAQFGFIYAGLILLVLMWRPLGTTSKLLRFFGEISYALYVIHEFIGYVIILKLMEAGVPRWPATFAALVVVIGLAYLLTRFIDKPLRKPLRNLVAGTRPGRTPAPAAAP